MILHVVEKVISLKYTVPAKSCFMDGLIQEFKDFRMMNFQGQHHIQISRTYANCHIIQLGLENLKFEDLHPQTMSQKITSLKICTHK